MAMEGYYCNTPHHEIVPQYLKVDSTKLKVNILASGAITEKIRKDIKLKKFKKRKF